MLSPLTSATKVIPQCTGYGATEGVSTGSIIKVRTSPAATANELTRSLPVVALATIVTVRVVLPIAPGGVPFLNVNL